MITLFRVCCCCCCCFMLSSSQLTRMIILHSLFRLPLLALGQSYDSDNASEVTLRYIDKIDPFQNTKKPELYAYSVRCHYNAVNFLPNPHWRAMGCLLWFWYLIHFLPLFSQCRIWYRDKLDRVITALHCIYGGSWERYWMCELRRSFGKLYNNLAAPMAIVCREPHTRSHT